MERLTGLDASFLYLETPQQLLHVCGLVVLDPSTMPQEYQFERLRAAVEARVRDIPMFTRKLKQVPLGLDHPVWVDDTDFDVRRHIHRLALPAPGGDAELADLCGHLAGLPLDRGRPLWEMWVIEGLDSGRVAVFMKMHHASVDGVNGANMISHLCSLEPDEPLLDLAPTGTRPG
ncbi:MAG: wax ester/triacylglycerol synthase family O-acyltransferase, partial [Myxococcales bacterium]